MTLGSLYCIFLEKRFPKTVEKTKHLIVLQFINLTNPMCFKSTEQTFIKHNNDPETEANKLADIQYEI